MLSGADDRRTIGVLIADDHPIVRGGLREALGSEPDIRLLGEATNGMEAEELAVKLNPDVIVMDLYMPRRNGIQSMASIKHRLPGVKVLLLTVSEREEDLTQAIRFGADGYLLKESDPADVVRAVRNVFRGEVALSPRIAATVMKELREGREKPLLSVREQEVLDLLSAGLTNAEIAGRLFVGQATVATYVYRLVQKLHLRNRAEAIAYSARQLGRHEPF